uniref:Bradykinin receptor B2 n=1 Tax=Lates calcarifer TaxID=8187 RepID=A0A4W6EK02_LATCA
IDSSIKLVVPMATHGDQNSTNDNNCYPPESEEWIYTMVPVYFLVITVLGFIFDVFVLMVFCLHKKACTVAEIYLSNLAAADLILVSCLPFWAVYLSFSMNINCSNFLLVLVNIDRYMALVHPLSHERLRRPKFAKLSCCCCCWCGEVKYFSGINATVCYLNYPNTTVLLLCEGMLIVMLIIPIPIVYLCTFKIVKALNNQVLKRANTQKMERKATTLMVAVFVVFLISRVPLHLVKVIEWLMRAQVLRGCRLGTIVDICKQIFLFLTLSSSVFNPILYVIVGKNFQEKVKELFHQWKINLKLGYFGSDAATPLCLQSLLCLQHCSTHSTI